MVKNLLILYSIFILNQIEKLFCNDKIIENCEKYGNGENSDTCIKCDDKYFPFFNNLYCFPCDNEDYGQIGCGGNCNSSRFKQDRLVYCNQNECKEGYYYLNGICFNCSIGSPGCKTCNVNEIIMDNQKNYSYNCQECLNNKDYKLDEFGRCQKCKMDNCKKCYYNENYTKEFEECNSYYYLSSDKTCKNCKYKSIGYGYCTVCSDNITDYESTTCNCYSDSVLNLNKSCIYCGQGCNHCILKDDKPYCLTCSSGTFIDDNKCLICPSVCSKCIIDNNNQTKCISCYSGYALTSNGTCKFCGSGCNNCIIKQNNEISCLSCSPDYALNLKGTCTYCRSIDYIGGYGCSRCEYNNSTNKYECNVMYVMIIMLILKIIINA